MSGWAYLRGYTVETDLDERCEGFTGRVRTYSRDTFKVQLDLACDGEFLGKLYEWLHGVGMQGNLPGRPALPSAQPRLPAPPVEGELLDPEENHAPTRHCAGCRLPGCGDDDE